MGSKAKDDRAVAIGQRIKQARLEAGGMKQRELADLLGVTERSVIAYEQGEVIPYRFMHELANLLEKPASWLLHGDEEAAMSDGAGNAEILKELKELRKEIRALASRLS